MNSVLRHAIGLAVAVVALGASLSEAQATIVWGSSSTSEDYYQSDGTSDFSTSFTYELGYFDSSFTPTDSNKSSWATNWVVFDAASYVEVIPGTGVYWFRSSAAVESGGTSSSPDADPSTAVFPGEQAYVWIYDTQTAGPGMEWLLYTNDSSDSDSTDDWIFPSYQGQNPATLEWTVENASAVVFGGINDTQGPGQYDSPGGGFELQTHTVPEPSSALFLTAMFVGACLTRRRRREAP